MPSLISSVPGRKHALRCPRNRTSSAHYKEMMISVCRIRILLLRHRLCAPMHHLVLLGKAHLPRSTTMQSNR